MSTFRIRKLLQKFNFVIPECFYRESSSYKINNLWIPVCTGMTTFAIVAIFFVLPFVAGATGVETEKLLTSFVVENSSGKVDSTELFVGRHVVFAVLGSSCPGVEPFLAWRKRLSLDKVGQALILCIGTPPATDSFVFSVAPNEAMHVLGITGTPMLLGIEENHVKWRIAGLIPKWQVLAENWIKKGNEQN